VQAARLVIRVRQPILTGAFWDYFVGIVAGILSFVVLVAIALLWPLLSKTSMPHLPALCPFNYARMYSFFDGDSIPVDIQPEVRRITLFPLNLNNLGDRTFV